MRPRTDADQWDFKSPPDRNAEPTRTRNNASFDAAQPVGNFLLQERSMAAKQERTFPFTEKFRESIIQRLLNGHVTIREIRDELHLSETDLLSWIDDCLQQKQRRIDQMSALLATFQSAPIDKIGHAPHDFPSSAKPNPTMNHPSEGPRQVFSGEVLPPTPKR